MKNSIIRILSLFLCAAVFIMPVSVFAAEESCTLTLTYTKENVIFSNLEIRIYRIADRNFELISPYDSYPVQVMNNASQAELSDTAATLRGYIQADSIEPYALQYTDEDGKVSFNGIEQGLYLVAGVQAQAQERIYTFYDFMIFLPMIDEGEYIYDVSAKPKSGIDDPENEEKTYTVLKLWKDSDSTGRPASVTVDILRNAEVYRTVTLDPANNWSYSFKADPNSSWSVVERNVAGDYTVRVTEKGTAFIITNTLEEKNTPSKPNDPSPPQTGDTVPMKLYMILLCISGFMLVILGIGMRRKDNARDR